MIGLFLPYIKKIKREGDGGWVGGVREREVEDRLGKSGGRGRLNALLQQNQI